MNKNIANINTVNIVKVIAAGTLKISDRVGRLALVLGPGYEIGKLFNSENMKS